MEGAIMKPTRWAATIGFAPTEAKNYLNLTIEYIEEAKNDCHKIRRSAKSSRASRKITQVMTLRRRSADRRGTSALCCGCIERIARSEYSSLPRYPVLRFNDVFDPPVLMCEGEATEDAIATFMTDASLSDHRGPSP
jgi:hypothetical protein